MEDILLLITKIETVIAKLEESNKDKYQKALNELKRKYEEELKNIKEHELTLRPESLVLYEYQFKLMDLLEKITLESDFKYIKDFCLSLELNNENLKEKLLLFESVEEEYKRIKGFCDSDTLKELMFLIHSVLYKFVYNEIKYYNEDNILQTLGDDEKTYLTKILIDEIKKVNNKELEELLRYYELNNENILNKDVIDKLVEIELKEKNQERTIVKQEKTELNEPQEELVVKKEESFSEKVSQFIKGFRKIPAKKFFKKYGIGSIKIASTYHEVDWSIVSFDDYDISGWDFSNTNVDINPQKVFRKSLWGVNLTNVDMSGKSFDGVSISCANLTNTNADIDPQKVYNKDLSNCILNGLDFQGKSFDGVDICGTNFEGAKNLDIDFQKLASNNLRKTNLRGQDLSNKNLDNIFLQEINLEGTHAKIEPQKVIGKNLRYAILRGLDLSHRNFSGVHLMHTDFRGANIYGSNFKGAFNLERAIFDEEQKKYLFESQGIVLNNSNETTRHNVKLGMIVYNNNNKINGKKMKLYREKSDGFIGKYNTILFGKSEIEYNDISDELLENGTKRKK